MAEAAPVGPFAARYDVVIVGAGHGGAQAAIALRNDGFIGTIALIGDECDLPYERPPLSKEYLADGKTFEQILIRPREFWADTGISLLSGHRIVTVDPVSRTIVSATGQATCYGTLIWAAGATPRRLTCSGHHLAGVHTVRTVADVHRMKTELNGTTRVVVIGGGYIGLETAAVLTTLGKHVTVLEAQDRVLARVAGETLSRFFEAEHRAHGVDVRLNARVACIEERDGRAGGVQLASGEILACEMVVVGIGVDPSVWPLEQAGADIANGVVVDAFCRTSLPGIHAIGDCAAHANAFAGGATIRLESLQNAIDQANTVAALLTGTSSAYHKVPVFWSNQYDVRLQTVGLSLGHDGTVTRGDPGSRSFSVLYLQHGKIIALDCINALKDAIHGKALVERGAVVPPDVLANPRISLKTVAAAASDAEEWRSDQALSA